MVLEGSHEANRFGACCWDPTPPKNRNAQISRWHQKGDVSGPLGLSPFYVLAIEGVPFDFPAIEQQNVTLWISHPVSQGILRHLAGHRLIHHHTSSHRFLVSFVGVLFVGSLSFFPLFFDALFLDPFPFSPPPPPPFFVFFLFFWLVSMFLFSNLFLVGVPNLGFQAVPVW